LSQLRRTSLIINGVLVIKASQNASDALLSSHSNYKVLKIQNEQKQIKSSNKSEVNMVEHERYTNG
jgi:hypothetical protein